jgi:hypothetical protein
MIPFKLLLSPLFDAGGPLLLIFFGIALLSLVIISIFIIIVEALLLQQRFHYGSFAYSIVTSLLMNVTSTIVGFCLVFLLGDMSIEGFGGYSFIFFLSWLLTVASEGGVLFLMNRQLPARKIWQMSVVVNLVTYFMLLFLSSFYLPRLPVWVCACL